MSNAIELAQVLRHMRNHVTPEGCSVQDFRAALEGAAEELELLAVDTEDAERYRYVCESDWFVGPPVGPDHNISRTSLTRAIDRAKRKGEIE